MVQKKQTTNRPKKYYITTNDQGSVGFQSLLKFRVGLAVYTQSSLEADDIHAPYWRGWNYNYTMFAGMASGVIL